MFKGRSLLIATKHEKEKAIGPILEKELGVKCFVIKELDTDLLGTFTGEVERLNDSITTVRNKCLLAMELADCDLALASEGSFGPHPSIFFGSADDEFLILIDKKNDLEIIARELSLETNFNGSEIKNDKELSDFIQLVKFPTHGLIMRKDKDDFTDIVKGITNHEDLTCTFRDFILKYGKAFIETDMRAMYNPLRMEVIKKATLKLANKVNTACPNCATPGFGITGSNPGLPCQLCNFPTRSTLSYVYMCQKCKYIKEEKYPNEKQREDPMYCDICNP
jgi:hypothetical protein